MLEITEQNIKDLNDIDLREIVGKLCCAEVRKSGYSDSYVTYGGHQKAPDGGIDVRISLLKDDNIRGYIPNINTGIQVKENNMTQSQIKKEMCPNGIIRDSIKELIAQQGAYIIVSGNASTSDTELKSRIEEMKNAAKSIKGYKSVFLDFYDSKRIAEWANNFPSIVVQLKEKLGIDSYGWSGYKCWSNPAEDASSQYIVDEQAKFFSSNSKSDEGRTITEGINELREVISQEKASVRLVGLSGVGKTRFVQALFDDRVGDNVLDPNCVLYTDIGLDPTPTPQVMINKLIASNSNDIIIIDNCPPQTHAALTKLLKNPACHLKLLTIEYDVRDDHPEDTKVYKLEKSSDELITQLLDKNFGNMVKANLQTIANLSDGNARVAICLAKSIDDEKNITKLTDEDLFQRLFAQRKSEDVDLYEAATILSLVYSYNNDTSENSELGILSMLTDMSILKLFKHTQELQRRGLVQSRGQWRAVLPHAIANKLAEISLQNIPSDTIINEFSKNTRLLISFARRLSYLTDNKEAEGIAKSFFEDDGILSNISMLNRKGIEVLRGVAFIQPNMTLRAIEKIKEEEFFTRENSYHNEITNILAGIAYYDEYFERAVKLLARFAVTEKRGQNYNSIRNKLTQLFQIYLSGTHATISRRQNLIGYFFRIGEVKYTELALDLLATALQVYGLSGMSITYLGSGIRDYGVEPNRKEWYENFIDYSVFLIKKRDSLSDSIKKVLARKLDSLIKLGLLNKVEETTKSILEVTEWELGWIAIKQLLMRNRNKHIDVEMPKDIADRVKKLEMLLNPQNSLSLLKAYTFSDEYSYLHHLARDNEVKNFQNETKRISSEIANNYKDLEEFIPNIFISNCTTIYHFGFGLATGSDDIYKTWGFLKKHFLLVENRKRGLRVFYGFFSGLKERDIQLFNEILDSEINGEFAYTIPRLQSYIGFDKKGIERILLSLKIGEIPAFQYENIGYGRAHELINDSDMLNICNGVLKLESGYMSVLSILEMRFIDKKVEEISPELLSLAKEMINYVDFYNDNSPDVEHRIKELIKFSFSEKDEDDLQLANSIFSNYFAEIKNNPRKFFKITNLIFELGQKFTNLFLENLFQIELEKWDLSELIRYHEWRETSLSSFDVKKVIDWCNDDSKKYIKISELVTISGTYSIELLNAAPNKSEVLQALVKYVEPFGSWSGDRSNYIAKAIKILETIKNNFDDEFKTKAIQLIDNLDARYRELVEQEKGFWNREAESFEEPIDIL